MQTGTQYQYFTDKLHKIKNRQSVVTYKP